VQLGDDCLSLDLKKTMKSNETVSVSELKKKLSYYLRRVKRGSSIRVTVRGQSVAIWMSAGTYSDTQIARKLSQKGFGSWKGDKPKGGSRRISVKGKPVSEIVIEELR
jgi:prevent-host-death family protein